MVYFRHPISGLVFAYETQAERDQFGPPELLLMTEEEVQEHLAPPTFPSPPPAVVTMRQARLALLAGGLLAAVEDSIDALPSPQREAARIEWEYSQEVHRDRPFVQLLGAGMGLTEAQLDNLFTQAAQL